MKLKAIPVNTAVETKSRREALEIMSLLQANSYTCISGSSINIADDVKQMINAPFHCIKERKSVSYSYRKPSGGKYKVMGVEEFKRKYIK